MSHYYYKKERRRNVRKIFRMLGLSIFLSGFLGALYVFFPLVSWQIYFAPVFASYNIETPIPKTTVITPSSLKSLLSASADSFSGIDYTNGENWFPTINSALRRPKGTPRIQSYHLSIPKLNIKNALVSTVDYDLSMHLLNYGGTAIPPENGNAVIFGHSTLPHLFNQNDYKTIFANVYKLKAGDEIWATVSNVSYLYKVQSISVVDQNDTTAFAQNYDNSYLTLVTCTPPGTVWKRLIIKATLEKL